MNSRSKIRQTALTAIYAVMENGGKPEDMDWDLFWEIAEEKRTEQLHLATAKAIEHLCRTLADTSRILALRADAVNEAMEGDLTTAPLRERLERYMRSSKELDAALGTLHYSLRNKIRISTQRIGVCNDDVLNLADVVIALGEELVVRFADFPAYRSRLSPLEAIVRRRAKVLAGCNQLKAPERMQDSADFKGLIRLAKDMKELRPAVQSLTEGVLEKLPELDACIESLLQNYSADRLDTVDKCILYVSLYELKANKLDVPIIVSEATALADTYSGGKSAPFIHGIIAAAAKA